MVLCPFEERPRQLVSTPKKKTISYSGRKGTIERRMKRILSSSSSSLSSCWRLLTFVAIVSRVWWVINGYNVDIFFLISGLCFLFFFVFLSRLVHSSFTFSSLSPPWFKLTKKSRTSPLWSLEMSSSRWWQGNPLMTCIICSYGHCMTSWAHLPSMMDYCWRNGALV